MSKQPFHIAGMTVVAESLEEARALLGEQIHDQPPPQENDLPCIQDLVMSDLEQEHWWPIELVIEDIRERKRIGIERYGMPLRPHNGRDVLVDLYQELIDALQYTKQAIWEYQQEGDEVVQLEVLYGQLRSQCLIIRKTIYERDHTRYISPKIIHHQR